MPESIKALDGANRAAILLLTLGEEHAAGVLKHMGPREVQRIGAAMADMGNVTSDQVTDTVDEFLKAVGHHTALGMDSENYIRNVLVKALGQDKAAGLIDRILLGGNAQGLETLKWMEARAVAEVIRNEHPQIIAIVLSYLDADHAAAILTQLPERTQPDILMRISTLDAVQPAALQQLNEMLEKQVSGPSNLQSAAVGGVKCAAEILNFLDSSVESTLMEKVKEVDDELGTEIQDLMFVFENLREVDDPGIQTLLREVSSENLLLALKGADEDMQSKFLNNMSKRAAEMLRDDMESKGPVRVSEVEAAQKEILGIARRLADDGQIMLGGKGGDDFV